jgi:hypothetical protein
MPGQGIRTSPHGTVYRRGRCTSITCNGAVREHYIVVDGATIMAICDSCNEIIRARRKGSTSPVKRLDPPSRP